jgi:hypothetical protein
MMRKETIDHSKVHHQAESFDKVDNNIQQKLLEKQKQ